MPVYQIKVEARRPERRPLSSPVWFLASTFVFLLAASLLYGVHHQQQLRGADKVSLKARGRHSFFSKPSHARATADISMTFEVENR